MGKYKIVDLFAGVGGLSYGFLLQDEFEIIMANEIEKDISKAYTFNHPDVNMINCDINELTEEVIKEAIGDNVIDIVVGGPPCQSCSTLVKRRMVSEQTFLCNIKEFLVLSSQEHLFLKM